MTTCAPSSSLDPPRKAEYDRDGVTLRAPPGNEKLLEVMTRQQKRRAIIPTCRALRVWSFHAHPSSTVRRNDGWYIRLDEAE